jgi:hypothetical protein
MSVIFGAVPTGMFATGRVSAAIEGFGRLSIIHKEGVLNVAPGSSYH